MVLSLCAISMKNGCFALRNEPELVVDPAYPPKYIIVTEEGEVRFSTPEEGNDVYQLTNVL